MNTSDNRNCVRSVKDAASILGISYATLKRLLASGDGPKVTRLTQRRVVSNLVRSLVVERMLSEAAA
jgi:predicted site-specific integrase-resolvase